MHIISFILHNSLRKLMFWAVKHFVQDYTVSDRKGLRCMSTWPRSVCSAWCCSHRGNCGHSVFSIVKGDPFMFWAPCTWPCIPASSCLKQLSPFRTLEEEGHSLSEAFPVNSFSFPAWNSSQVFSKKESQGNHISV